MRFLGYPEIGRRINLKTSILSSREPGSFMHPALFTSMNKI
jgi:hypothetical protein